MHGTAFELLRNSAVEANAFFHNGHNKTFIFGDYEGLRQTTPNTNRDTVPTALERAGNSSQKLNQAGAT